MSVPDLFWQWSINPGNLVPVKRIGPFTITNSGAGGVVLWYYDRPIAQGARATIDMRLSFLLSFQPSQDALPQAASV